MSIVLLSMYIEYVSANEGDTARLQNQLASAIAHQFTELQAHATKEKARP